MANIYTVLKQSMCIAAPTFTEKKLPDQTGKVHIVTGGYTGVGFELTGYLYGKNATVYVAGRAESKATPAIAALREKFPSSTGALHFMSVDLADFRTIKPAVEAFLQKETRLDVLVNNAGVMFPPDGSKDAHGHEMQLGTNCLGPFLLTDLLLPILRKTATSPNTTKGSVRVTWAASIAVMALSPKDGVQFDACGSPQSFDDSKTNYGQSKTGNFYLAAELAKRYGSDGIVSVAFNPGNLNTELGRHTGSLAQVATKFAAYHPKFGAYTELYAGWSPEITAKDNGGYIIPWGKLDTQNLRKDVLASSKRTADGGSGVAEKFWEYCDKETQAFR